MHSRNVWKRYHRQSGSAAHNTTNVMATLVLSRLGWPVTCSRQPWNPVPDTRLHRDVPIQAYAQLISTPDLSCSTSQQSLPDSSPLQGRFVIPAGEVSQHLQHSGLSLEQFLFSLIQPASRLALPPISKFHVGSVALGGSGAVYVGVNIEFPTSPLNNSIHAEQCLLVNCLHHGEQSIKAIAVSAAPCGHCRQFYCETVCADAIEFIFGKDARPKYLRELLPERFGPHDLISDHPFPLLLEPQHNNVEYRSTGTRRVAERGGDLLFVHARAAALEEAQKAYAPYTSCPAGAAIITKSGQVFSGGSIESAAYNPTLSPFHAAVVDGITSGLRDMSEIQEVVLAELYKAPVSYKANIQLLLKAVAPSASITVLPLERVPP